MERDNGAANRRPQRAIQHVTASLSFPGLGLALIGVVILLTPTWLGRIVGGA